MKTLAIIGLVVFLVGCASGPTDEEVCASKGFEPQAGEMFWRCMSYVQTERAIKEQQKMANAAILGVVKPRTCNTYGGSVQCW